MTPVGLLASCRPAPSDELPLDRLTETTSGNRSGSCGRQRTVWKSSVRPGTVAAVGAIVVSSILNVTFDRADGEWLARFWSGVTGWA